MSRSAAQLSQSDAKSKDIMRTEKVGGTETSFPVLLSRLDMGTMRSALGAGGCAGDDAKKVACRTASSEVVSSNCPEPIRRKTYLSIYHPDPSQSGCQVAR